jgi:hypothetical protein
MKFMNSSLETRPFSFSSLMSSSSAALLVALASPALAQDQPPPSAVQIPPSPLEAKLAQFRAKLEKVSRETAPAEWGRLQFEIGDALIALGQRERSPARLEAVSAFDDGLTVWSEEKAPQMRKTALDNRAQAQAMLDARSGR